MKIGIIGAGFTGLAAGFRLAKDGNDVTIFEKDSRPGGLAIGYQKKEWSWSLEQHYHHWFTNDNSILNLAKEINHNVLIRRPHTNWFVHSHIYQFDSIRAALLFPELPLTDRVRNLATLGLLRLNPFWKPLEQFNASEMLPILMGRKAYQLLWEPLLHNKFGEYQNDISLAWFWARIKKRTQSLAYPEGGFLHFAEHIANELSKDKGKIIYNVELQEIQSHNKHISLRYKKLKSSHDIQSSEERFDRVIVTLPSFLFLKLAPQLPKEYKNRLSPLKGIGATNLILRMKKPFFQDDTYWLSIADPTSPIMAIVEHTNFMDSSHYNNEHLVYIGNYLPSNHPNYLKDKEELLDLYNPYLEKINADYKDFLISYELFKAPFAQPIVPKNYSRLIPPMKTPLNNVFLVNMEQVYPWDRGTNYAVEMGERIANILTHS